MSEKGTRPGVVLAAFLFVCVLADVSPLLKLRPDSPVVRALLGGLEPGKASVLFAAFALITLAAPAVVVWLVSRRPRSFPTGFVARGISALLLLAVLLAIHILGPRAEGLHAIGLGSDQASCIQAPAMALARGDWPYNRDLVSSGNACSPGLGWIAVATPFVLLGSYAGFLVFGAALLVALPERILGARTVTATLVLVFSCTAAWQSVVTGADNLAIGMGFALVTALIGEPRLTIALGIGAGLVGTARLPFAFFPLALTAYLYAGGQRARARAFGAASFAVLAVAHGAPLAINALSYREDGPLHLFLKGERLAEHRGGPAILAACALAWLAYAAMSLRAPRGHDGRDGRGGEEQARSPGPSTLQFHIGTLTLLCIAGPALVELLRRDTLEDLSAWQGGNWLVTALPCYAASLAIAFRVPSGRWAA